MSHPCLVTLDSRSAPRTLFSGDQLVDVDLPTGTRVVYPKQPIEALKDVDAAIRYAINHPENSEPLYAKHLAQLDVIADDAPERLQRHAHAAQRVLPAAPHVEQQTAFFRAETQPVRPAAVAHEHEGIVDQKVGDGGVAVALEIGPPLRTRVPIERYLDKTGAR